MPTIRQLRYFVAVTEKLHFRLAAEACHVTQPTLSMQLRELELRLGVQLVERNRHKVLITPIGREIEKCARSVLRDVQDIVRLAEQDRSALGGIQKVGALPTLGPYLMPHILPALRKKHPSTKLFLREEIAQNLLLHLESGDLDIAFLPLPLRSKDLEFIELFAEPLWLAIPKDHPLSAKSELEDGDLRGETILILEDGHRLHNQVLELCDLHEAHPHLEFEGTSLDTLRQMVGMGIGATFLPALYVHAEAIDDEEITVRLFKAPFPQRRIAMAWRRSSSRRKEYLLLADFIVRVLKKQVPEMFPTPR